MSNVDILGNSAFYVKGSRPGECWRTYGATPLNNDGFSTVLRVLSCPFKKVYFVNIAHLHHKAMSV